GVAAGSGGDPAELLRLVAAVVFISFGVVAAFCCAVVDGVFAARHIRLWGEPRCSCPEPRPLMAGRCQFYSSGAGYLHDVYQTEVTCPSPNGGCPLKVKSNTCYCCDLYDCQGPPAYHEFVGVGACRDALQLYWLLWASAVLNVLGLLLGVVTAAVLGAFKDAVPLAHLAYGRSTAPRVLCDPAQQILAYSGFRAGPPAIPTCSSYPLPLQLPGGFAASPGSDLPLPEDSQPQPSSSCQHPPSVHTHLLPREKPPPYTP
ncbi:hypothetical protein FD754_021868, partial [Muntiacus muntjak]